MGHEGTKRRLHKVIEQLEVQEAAIIEEARSMGMTPELVRTRDGGYLMLPLLVAQAQALSALQALEADKRHWRNVD